MTYSDKCNVYEDHSSEMCSNAEKWQWWRIDWRNMVCIIQCSNDMWAEERRVNEEYEAFRNM